MKSDSEKNKFEKLDKVKIEVEGLSVYVEKYDRYPEVEFDRSGINTIQVICIESILQGKDLLCRSVVLKEDTDSKKHLNERIMTWIVPIANKVLRKKKAMVIVPTKDIGESVKKEIHDLTRSLYPKIVTVFSRHEDNLDDLDVLITTATYGGQLLSKKKVDAVFDILLVDECQKFNEDNFFRTVYEIKRQLSPDTQVAVFSPLFSKDNFEMMMSQERVVVEVESLGDVKQEVCLSKTEGEGYSEAVHIIKGGKYNFKGSWREVVEIDKILVIVKDYNKVESHFVKEKLPFKTLNYEGGHREDSSRDEQAYKEGVIDKFKGGAFPILIVNRFSTRRLNISGLSLVISLDSSNSIRDYLFRSTLLKKGGKLVTFVSEDTSSRHLEDLICTLEVNRANVPEFLRKMKGKSERHEGKAERHKSKTVKHKSREVTDLSEDLERITLTEDKVSSEDEQLHVWG